MKKLLLTAAVGLGLGGGAWKYQNPEGTLDDLRSDAKITAETTYERLKVGIDAVRDSSPDAIREREEQIATLESRREAQAQAVDDRLAKLENFVLSPADADSGSDIDALTTATDELREDTDTKLASTAAQVANTAAKVNNTEAKIADATDKIGENAAKVADAEAKIVDTAEKVADAEIKIGDAVAKISAVESKIAETDAELEDTVGKIAATDATVSNSLKQQQELLSAVEKMQGTVESLQNSVNSMSQNSDSGLAKIDAIDSRIELLVRRLDEQTFDTDIANLREGLQTLGADVIDIKGSQTQQTASIASDIASMSETNASLNSRLDTLAALAQQVSDATTDSSSSSNASSVSAPALASLSAGIDERFGVLEERLQTVNADSRRIRNLGDQLGALRGDLAAIKQQNENTGRALEAVNSEISGLKTASESLSIETVQDEIRTQLSSVQSQLESSSAKESGNSAELESLINTTRNRIKTLEQRVQDLPASSTEADNAQQIQSALEFQISALEKRLESINTTDPELANTLSNVQEQVQQLAAQSFVTKEDLKAESEGRTVEYKIYFNSNSSAVTDGAEEILNSFIEREKNRTIGVSIFGFTDRSGSANYNQQLALQRATNVRSFLIQNGMDYTKIKALTGLGEDAAARVLPDNAKDSEQRVVVLYAEQP